MSMLAEKREKKKYHLLPRGKPLYEDANNFGTRMLEKMGWSKGKGLGANENGSPDFIRVQYKNDNVGIGYEDRDDGWTKHEKNFEDLLKSLHNSKENSDVEEDQCNTAGFGFQKQKQIINKIEDDSLPKFSSLEEKSKKSKARIHYKKFTRGKDISQYTEKDLANIFGRKELNKKVIEENCDEVTVNENCSNSEILHSYGVTTITTGTSVQDYFKKKIGLLKDKSNEYIKVELENTTNFVTSEEVSDMKKLKKRKEKKTVNVEENNERTEQEKDEFQILSNNEKSKKRKKQIKSEIEDNNSDNPTLKREKKKRKLLNHNENDTLIHKQELNLNNEVKTKKYKSKKSKTFKNDQLDNVNEDFDDASNETNEPLTKNITDECINKTSKDKKRKSIQEEMKSGNREDENIILSNSKVIEHCFPEEDFTKKTKRKKHKGNTDSIDQNDNQLNGIEKLKRKKYKRKHEDEDDNLVLKDNPDENKNSIGVNEKKKLKISNAIKNSVLFNKKKTEEMEQESSNIKNTTRKEKKENKDCNLKKSKSKKEKNKENNIEPEIKEKNENVSEKQHEKNDGKPEEVQKVVESTVPSYNITCFTAEKFRHTDLKGFIGSNLDEIVGYGLDEKMRVRLIYKDSDQKNIANMWNNVIDKYKTLEKDTNKKLNLKRLKKKKIFVKM